MGPADLQTLKIAALGFQKKKLVRMVLGGRRGGLGGAQRIVEGLQQRFERAGWTVEWFTPADLPSVPSSARFPGLNESLRAQALSRALRRMPRADLTISHGMYGLRTPGRRIHAYHGTSAGLGHACRAGVHPLDFVVTRWVDGSYEQWSGMGAHRVSVSQPVKSEVARFYGLSTHQIIHNGVDQAHFVPGNDRAEARRRWSLPEDAYLALVVGRMDYGKGREVLRAMLPHLPEQVKFVVAAPSASKMETFPQDRLILLPGIDYDELPMLYRACNVLLCASLYEGFGLTLLEGWACGLPVVSGRIGLAMELRGVEPSFDACVAPVADAEGLAAGIRRLIDEPELARRQAEWGRAQTETRFSAERFDADWWALVERVIG